MHLALAILVAQAQTNLCADIRLEGKFAAYCHRAEAEPKVFFPLPLDYRAQVPVSFELKVSPVSRMVGARTYAEDGNQIVELALSPMKREDRVDVSWSARVLAKSPERFNLPDKVPFPESWPSEVSQWLEPTPSVDSDNSRLRAKSAELRGGDVIETIDRIVAGCVGISAKQKGQARDMAASIALTTRGSCTSDANLMAALFRANGIPARILAGYPTWSNAPFQTHYIVETYVSGFGWLPIESSAYAKGWSCADMPLVSIVSVANERKGVERLNGGAGVAYLSLNESSAGLVVRGQYTREFADHRAKTLPDPVALSSEDWTAKQRAWHEWLQATRVTWKNFSG